MNEMPIYNAIEKFRRTANAAKVVFEVDDEYRPEKLCITAYRKNKQASLQICITDVRFGYVTENDMLRWLATDMKIMLDQAKKSKE